MLVIHDDVRAVEALEQLVSTLSPPWVLSRVTTFAEGFERLRRENFDTIVVNIGVADAPGTDTISVIRTASPEAPVIAITTTELTEEGVLALGDADAFVTREQIREEQMVRSLGVAGARRREIARLRARVRDLEPVEASLQHVVHHSGDAVLTLDRRGTVLAANPSAELMFECPLSECVGTSFGYPMVPGEWVRVEVLRSDGGTLFAELHVAETIWRGQRALLASFRDVTARVQAVEARRAIEAKTTAILESAGEGVLGLDPDGRIELANRAASACLGVPPDELIGRPYHEAVQHLQRDGSPLPVAMSPVTGCLASGVVSREVQGAIRRADGSTLSVDHTTAPIVRDGVVVGVVVTFSDVTDKQVLEAQLANARKMEGVGQLAAGIIHEISTPCTYVSEHIRFINDMWGDIQAMLERLGPDQRPDTSQLDIPMIAEEVPLALSQSAEGLVRITDIVRSMREFAHPGSKTKEPADINSGIESTITVCRSEWRYVAQVELDLDDSLPFVTCHLPEINQVVLNLVVNAAHAIGDQSRAGGEIGQITVRTRSAGEHVRIEVEDDGPGIPPEALDKIFEPFFTTKEVGRGTGQGLAITRAVIEEKHGGNIRVSSEVGRGTTFTIQLPIAASMVDETVGHRFHRQVDPPPAPRAPILAADPVNS